MLGFACCSLSSFAEVSRSGSCATICMLHLLHNAACAIHHAEATKLDGSAVVASLFDPSWLHISDMLQFGHSVLVTWAYDSMYQV